MKKLLALVIVCIYAITGYAQDSVTKVKTVVSAPATKPQSQSVAGHKAPPINKLVQNVRYAYYHDKTDAEVAAIMYANKASYNGILDRIYNDWDAKKGISRATFDADIVKKYGDPFPSAKPALLPAVKTAVQPPASKAVTAPVKPSVAAVTDTTKPVDKPVETPSEKSLAGQYQYLLTKVYNYQQPLIAAFHKNVMDTLGKERAELKTANDKLALQNKTIDSLQGLTKSADQSLSDSNTKQNEVDLLGIAMDKSTYNLMMWGLVIIFGLTAAIVIARSGASSREAKYRTQLYNELEEEYKTYKVKANEKEKKLARELQTERNRLDDLLGK